MKYLYFLIIMLSINGLAQERNTYKLRIMGDDFQAFPLKVINTTTNETVTTDAAGFFSMSLKTNDELVLVENEFYQLRYQMKQADFIHNIVRIYPESKMTMLKEVEVRTVSTKSLGIDAQTIIENTPSTNMNMDFMAMFSWLVKKIKKKRVDYAIELRNRNEMNSYVASLPREIMTDYLKIPDELVNKFYYFMSEDYVVDEYIKQNDEARWKIYLLEKSFEFLEQENNTNER